MDGSSNSSWLPLPSNSEAQDTQLPSTSAKKKEQKRRPKPRDGTVLTCGVCNDRALGYNFDAITCESCKAFFRRNASKNKSFTCSFEGNCKLDAHTRKFCSGCRLKKCFSIGMKKDWILNETQLAKRRQRIRSQTSQPYPSVADSPNTCEVTTNFSSDEVSSPSPGSISTLKTDTDDDEYPKPLASEIMSGLQLMEKTYTTVLDAPYEGSSAVKVSANPKDSSDLFNLTDMFIRRLIKFGKVLPEFKMLSQEDQISILKGGIMEIFVLRSAMAFDKEKEKWKYKDEGGKKELDPKIIASALSSDMYSSHIQFVRSLHELINSNRLILMLLFIIELFSPDRPNLKNKEHVARSQEKYSQWLKAYMESVYPVQTAKVLYPKVLMKLTDVRNLGAESAKLAAHVDISKLAPLQKEMFDLD
ncbi:vitamin D3 receptor isoform X1 [Patella vulgata]|uniref:vitamin D3 receptor isoform X1 n=2 Tax=Patella vulgata TaxID=6465 RepID=UPI0021800A9B|nr:vitamin D3 receptor isoform X1 [Patella vulgata]